MVLMYVFLGKDQKQMRILFWLQGSINAALGNIDKEDSLEQHFIDTYLEGYGLSNPLKVEIISAKIKLKFCIFKY